MRSGTKFETALTDATSGGSGPDRRLAHEIAAGCLRERNTLDRIIKSKLTYPDRPIPDDVHDALRIGTYQLAFLDRIPKHAAVDTAVEITRSVGATKSTGFVNAVLRKLVQGIPTVPPTSLADEWSHPEWLVTRWVEAFGIEKTTGVLKYNNQRPGIHLHAVPGKEDAVRQALAEAAVELKELGDGAFEIEPKTVSELPGYREGWFFVQDITQKRLLEHAELPKSSTVWDACAAPGGKTMRMAPDYDVIASDRKKSRLRRLKQNAYRLSLDVPTFVSDLEHPPFRPDSLPVVLVDAPCTGTGAMARHPDARWRLEPDDIVRLAPQQKRLLASAATVVQPNGRLVYLTCSIEPEENGAQVEDFLANHQEFERSVPDREILPGTEAADGGFVASLVKRK